MVVDTISSGSFGTSLAKYQKVIISSAQGAGFYTALDTNRIWLEDYVRSGGILEVHAARAFAQGDWILPGGFGHVLNATDNVDIADASHYLLHYPLAITEVELEGWNSASHGYLNNTAGSSVIITDGAGEPVLIEARFGLGYIIATMQPVEWGYGMGYSDFLENMVWYCPTHESPPDGTLTGPVAILQDNNPWGSDGIQQILTELGVPFDIIPSTDFGTVSLSPYQKVIVASSQVSTNFYTWLTGNRTWLENYVNGGGICEIHAATQSEDWILPFGAGFNYNLTNNVEIINPFHPTLYHPYLICEPELEYYSHSSHGYFNNTIGSLHLMEDGLEAIYIENASGNGFLIATCITIEYAWKNNYSMFLENLVHYLPYRQVHLQPGDYIDTFWDTGGDYHEFNFTCIDILGAFEANITHRVQRFHSNHSIYEDSLLWMNLRMNTRISDQGSSWWSWGNYFTLMIPTAGLALGSAFPMWAHYGIIVGEVSHLWVNGISYDCWNVSWYDAMIPSFSLFEKSSGIMLLFSNPTIDVQTVASNLIPQPPQVIVTYPNGGETLNTTVTITWDAFDPNDDPLHFDLQYWNGSHWLPLVSGLTTLSYLWDTTTLPNGVDYRIRVIADDGMWIVSDESNAAFAIENLFLPPIELPWWWWIAVLAVVIIVVIIIIYLVMKRRSTSK
jgi:hypothetical protein